MRKKRPALATLVLIASASVSRAQDVHVVPLPDVRQALSGAVSQRESNIADIERLLSRPEAQRELAKAGLNSGQAQRAIAVMNDEELARLAARARTADRDVQGGFIKTILAIIGAITVIIILVAVLA